MVLTKLEFKKLSLEETLEVLTNKGIVVVRGVESTNKGDILVRLDPRAVPVTQISQDVTRDANSTYIKPYWYVHDIPFNYFVTRTVYEFNEDYRVYHPKFREGDIVRYFYEDGTGEQKEDTAIVEIVFVDKDQKVESGEEPNYYYHLSKVDYNLPEHKLRKL